MFTKQIKAEIETVISTGMNAKGYTEIVYSRDNLPSSEKELDKLQGKLLKKKAAIIVSYLTKDFKKENSPHYHVNPRLLIVIMSKHFTNDESITETYKYDIENLMDEVVNILFKTKKVYIKRDATSPLPNGTTYTSNIVIEYNNQIYQGES